MLRTVGHTTANPPSAGHDASHANEQHNDRLTTSPDLERRAPPEDTHQRPHSIASPSRLKAKISHSKAEGTTQNEATVEAAALEKPISPLLAHPEEPRPRTKGPGRRSTSAPSPLSNAATARSEAERVAQAHPAVRDMVAKLNTAITAARDHPQRGRVASVLTKLFNATDAVRALTAGADHEIRNDPDVRQALQGASEILGHMRDVMQSYGGSLPARTRRQLEAVWKEADQHLSSFAQDSTATFRVSVLALIRLINNTVLVGVPAVEKQEKTLALYNASASKSTIRAIGLARRPTTHGPQVLDHYQIEAMHWLQRANLKSARAWRLKMGLSERP
jgi:hypothetical protein